MIEAWDFYGTTKTWQEEWQPKLDACYRYWGKVFRDHPDKEEMTQRAIFFSTQYVAQTWRPGKRWHIVRWMIRLTVYNNVHNGPKLDSTPIWKHNPVRALDARKLSPEGYFCDPAAALHYKDCVGKLHEKAQRIVRLFEAGYTPRQIEKRLRVHFYTVRHHLAEFLAYLTEQEAISLDAAAVMGRRRIPAHS